jgi:hypothetical protein
MVVNIDALLPRVSKPARYTGGERIPAVDGWQAMPLRSPAGAVPMAATLLTGP